MTPVRFFLSHEHDDRAAVMRLEADLRRRGVTSWRDRKDQRLGDQTDPIIERAIAEQTDAFVMYGSTTFASSEYVWTREWPVAYRRHESEAEASRPMPYPIVPLFVGDAGVNDMKRAADAFGQPEPTTANGEHLDEVDETSRQMVVTGLLRSAVHLAAQRHAGALRLHLTTFAGADDLDTDLLVDWSQDFDGSAAPWSQLLFARDELKRALAELRRPIHVTAQARITAAFVFGHGFPRPARLPVSAGIGRWTVGDGDDRARVRVQTTKVDGHADVGAVIVSLARDVAVAAHQAVRDLDLQPSRITEIGFAGGVTVVDADVAAAASFAFKQTLRRMRDDGIVGAHVFLAVPADLAVLLGAAINAGPVLTLYHTEGGRYVPTLDLR